VTGQQAAASTSPGGDDAEKEAFDSAKELGTTEAWEAFISNYPSGFRADLARAYIKKLGASEASKDGAPSAPTAETLSALSESTPDPSCKERTKFRSKNSDTKTKITFVNRSGGMRDD
jgi:hypothetical protein